MQDEDVGPEYYTMIVFRTIRVVFWLSLMLGSEAQGDLRLLATASICQYDRFSKLRNPKKSQRGLVASLLPFLGPSQSKETPA